MILTNYYKQLLLYFALLLSTQGMVSQQEIQETNHSITKREILKKSVSGSAKISLGIITMLNCFQAFDEDFELNVGNILDEIFDDIVSAFRFGCSFSLGAWTCKKGINDFVDLHKQLSAGHDDQNAPFDC